MTPQSIDVTVFSFTHPNVIKRTNTPSVLLSMLFISIGLLLLLSMNKITDHTSTLIYVVMTIGTAFVGFGFYRLFTKSKKTVYEPTDSVVEKKSLFFDSKHLDQLRNSVFSGAFSVSSGMKSESADNIRMDVVISQDGRFSAVQLFQFVPYAYQPITTIHYYLDDDAESLASFLADNVE